MPTKKADRSNEDIKGRNTTLTAKGNSISDGLRAVAAFFARSPPPVQQSLDQSFILQHELQGPSQIVSSYHVFLYTRYSKGELYAKMTNALLHTWPPKVELTKTQHLSLTKYSPLFYSHSVSVSPGFCLGFEPLPPDFWPPDFPAPLFKTTVLQKTKLSTPKGGSPRLKPR